MLPRRIGWCAAVPDPSAGSVIRPSATRHDRAALLTIAVLSELGGIRRRIDLLDAAEYAMRAFFGAAADNAEFEAFRLTDEAQPGLRRAVLKQRGCCRRVYRRLREAALAEGASLAHAFVAVCRDELEVDPRELASAVVAPLRWLSSPSPGRSRFRVPGMIRRCRLGSSAKAFLAVGKALPFRTQRLKGCR
jgi:hypothetical protein